MTMTKKKILLGSIGCLCFLLGILLGGALYLLSYSLNPSGKAERDAASIAFLQELHPGTAEWLDSMQTTGVLRDTFIINNGHRLHAYYAQRPTDPKTGLCDAKGTVVLVHGYTDCAIRMMQYGKLYYDSLQYNILLPEHVRHGQSDGEAIQMGWLDRLNIERWIATADTLFHCTEHPFDTYLHGVSMGAATVMMCSGDELPTNVKGIIEDCGYTSVWEEFSGEIKNQFGLPIHPLMDVASWLCDLKYDWNFHEASALEQVRRSTLPMLFIHGDADTFVPYSMLEPLYEAKTQGYKQRWVAPGTAHARAYHDYPQRYREEVEKFLQHTRSATPEQ